MVALITCTHNTHKDTAPCLTCVAEHLVQRVSQGVDGCTHGLPLGVKVGGGGRGHKGVFKAAHTTHAHTQRKGQLVSAC